MDYRIYIYLITSLFAAFGLSGINFDKILKKNRYFESRILVVLLSLALGYLVTQFILEFL